MYTGCHHVFFSSFPQKLATNTPIPLNTPNALNQIRKLTSRVLLVLQGCFSIYKTHVFHFIQLLAFFYPEFSQDQHGMIPAQVTAKTKDASARASNRRASFSQRSEYGWIVEAA